MPRTGNINLDVQEAYESLMWVLPSINPGIGQIEPPARYKRTGLIAYADGTNWNPNSQGSGYYRYTGSAWVKFLEPDDTFTTSIDADKVDGFHVSQTPTASYALAAGSDGTMPIKPIWDKLVSGSAVTSVTTDGEVTLDGNAHGGYEFEFVIYNSTGSNTTIRMYANNDTTNANYNIIRHGFTWANEAIITDQLGAGTETKMQGIISLSPRGYLGLNLTEIYDGAAVWEWSWQKIATITNLTRIDIVSSVASCIGINSRFRLWRRK